MGVSQLQQTAATDNQNGHLVAIVDETGLITAKWHVAHLPSRVTWHADRKCTLVGWLLDSLAEIRTFDDGNPVYVEPDDIFHLTVRP